MKVILTEEIRGLGTRGDVVTVKDGYARNYLIPKNLAQEATNSNLKAIEHRRQCPLRLHPPSRRRSCSRHHHRPSCHLTRPSSARRAGSRACTCASSCSCGIAP